MENDEAFRHYSLFNNDQSLIQRLYLYCQVVIHFTIFFPVFQLFASV